MFVNSTRNYLALTATDTHMNIHMHTHVCINTHHARIYIKKTSKIKNELNSSGLNSF